MTLNVNDQLKGKDWQNGLENMTQLNAVWESHLNITILVGLK